MDTDLRNGENGNGRSGGGRFAFGNGGGPGRPPGCENRATGEAKRIKAALLATWDEYGPEAVRRLAVDDPARYVAVIAALLPREHEIAARADGELSIETLCRLRIMRKQGRLSETDLEATGIVESQSAPTTGLCIEEMKRLGSYVRRGELTNDEAAETVATDLRPLTESVSCGRRPYP